jgi:ABC-type sugar transport system ATPase subunit
LPANTAFLDERVVGPTTAPDDVLRLEHVSKRFGPVTALRDINLHLRKGEVLGLLGDNGAGKSTLIKIICGFQPPDAGEMWVKGQPYAPKSVIEGRNAGIDTVFQDLALIDQLSVYHNLFLRREKVLARIPFVNNTLMKREARKALDEIGINIPRIDVPVARLSGGQRQAIAVARTVTSDADIILLDEPLAAMGAKEGAMILDLIARIKAEGKVSVIMILHNYAHVFASCDRVALVQDGVITLDKPASETSINELNEIVVEQYRRARVATAEPSSATTTRTSASSATGAGSAGSGGRPTAPLPAPGWYRDPAGDAKLRWWDGTSWTSEVASRPAPGAVAGSPSTKPRI